MPDAPTKPVATDDEIKARRDARQAEYGTWVAVQPISYNGVLAYNPGDAVPDSNVKRHGYDEQGLVAKTTTKQAGEVVTALHEAATPSGEAILPPVSLGVQVPGTK